MLPRMWGKVNTPPLLVGVRTGIAASNISMAISHEVRKQPSSNRHSESVELSVNFTFS